MESVDVDGTEAERGETGDVHAESEICAAESCPGRTVFSESGNTDGWIGTNLVVDVEP